MSTPIQIGLRRELFVDDYLIESLHQASLRLSHPERREVVLQFDAPWEDGAAFGYSAITEGPVVRLFYRAGVPNMAEKDETSLIVAVAESRDGGLSFTRPSLGLVEYKGSKNNNILWIGAHPAPPPPFLDTNPACSPDARYKGFLYQTGAEVHALGSPDGLRWHLLQKEKLDMPGQFDSVNTSFWDTNIGKYRSYTRIYQQFKPSQGEWNDPRIFQLSNKPFVQGSRWGTWGKRGEARSMQMSTSDDFLHWSPPVPLKYADGDPVIQLYTNAIEPCPGAEHLYVGFPNRIVEERAMPEDQPWPGVNDALFMSSRDGLHWTRYREAWVRPGLDARNWTQRNNYPAWHIIKTSETEWSVLISEHYMQKDGVPGRMRRLSIRPWGFASVHADFDGGEMLTKPLLFAGKTLRLNYATSAAGSVQIGLEDPSGKPLDGFGINDMIPLFGDDLDAAVTWRGSSDLGRFAGTPVRLRVRLRDADLYALRFDR